MSRDLISCILPVYNGEEYLGETLESLFRQDYEPLEIVVVDDGSTDGTATILEAVGEKIRYVRQENAGPVAARNRGISESTGHFIAFVDADDLWAPNRMSCQHRALSSDPALDFVVCHVQNFWVDQLAEERDAWAGHPRSFPMPGYTSAGLLARRTAFERVGPFKEALGHADSADWFLRARGLGVRGGLIEDVLVRRRIHPNSRSRLMSQRSSEEFLRLIKNSLDERRAGRSRTEAE